MPDALPAATLPIYPGLGLASKDTEMCLLMAGLVTLQQHKTTREKLKHGKNKHKKNIKVFLLLLFYVFCWHSSALFELYSYTFVLFFQVYNCPLMSPGR